MEKHGSETFFVVGEGLLGETVGGREPRLAADAAAGAPSFFFSRMGPKGSNRQLTEANRKRVAQAMTVGGGGASPIPAGFTYLGQFIDHDLTFDKTNVAFGTHVPPSVLRQARSPSLDLDSLYGAGPQDPESAKFYKADGLHLKMGETVPVAGLPKMDDFDLPRGLGSTTAERRQAIIPDPRNDENGNGRESGFASACNGQARGSRVYGNATSARTVGEKCEMPSDHSINPSRAIYPLRRKAECHYLLVTIAGVGRWCLCEQISTIA